ncbi:hypothetical protein LTR70_010621 [Exophiala xenobiotica]|uniref:Enoyl reductase (ER) domain-containing protein n=1 Tax=Lithohypha guttulata TaxID=1690604 RepID=A0ABR0JU80_9EURO|nr:hypothetical protein LTR24_010591 [Lithohypha guttulata]KAK5309083.1 hypothetical protein LTR70_010621 [Exophiala xenobiotica]
MPANLPKTYKVGVFKEQGKPLTFEERELKLPEDGQVLVKVLACGVCHSDSMVRIGAFGNGFPIVPGHEIIGEIAAIPSSEKRWKEGDRVGGPWHGGHDNTCKSCRRGLAQMCENEVINGVTRDGGYGQYVTLRTEAVVSIPKDVDPVEFAPQLCAGVTVFNALRQQRIFPGETVAVQGLGGLGHLALQYVSKSGYRTVAISSSSTKKDFATKLGAHDYIDGSKGDIGKQLQELGGAACILLTAPNKKLIPQLLGGLGPLGKLVVLAAMDGPAEIDTNAMIGKGLSVSAWPSGQAQDSEDTIVFAQVHGVECMVEKFPLEQANEALEKMEKGDIRFRGVLTPNN